MLVWSGARCELSLSVGLANIEQSLRRLCSSHHPSQGADVVDDEASLLSNRLSFTVLIGVGLRWPWPFCIELWSFSICEVSKEGASLITAS